MANAGMGGVQGSMIQQNLQPMAQQDPNIFDTAAQGINTAIGSATQGIAGTPASIATANLGNYYNPFETQVVQQSLSDLDRARQMQANQIGAQATTGNAFGGSREALMQSELGRNYLDQSARTASGLRQAGFQNAQQMAGQDVGYGQAATAGLGNLSNLGFGMGMQLQDKSMQQGTQQQLINQALIDAAKQQFAGFTGQPSTALGYMASALGASAKPSTTENTKTPGLFDYLTLAASLKQCFT